MVSFMWLSLLQRRGTAADQAPLPIMLIPAVLIPISRSLSYQPVSTTYVIALEG